MALYFDQRNFLYKKKRRADVVDAEVVESTRKRFGLKKGEFAELLGLSNARYSRCLNQNRFLSFRFDAALNAIENVAINKALKDVANLHKIKTNLRTTNADYEVDDNNE